jgi:hypothetical protein
VRARLSRIRYGVAASRNWQHRGEGPAGAGTSAAVAAKAAAINAAQAHPMTWKTLVKRAVVVAVAGAAIYLVLPSLIAVLGAWPRQFSMLTAAGFDTDTAVGGLTAFSLLGVGGLLVLPLFALPAILAGVPVSPGLVHTALLGVAGFVLYTIFGVIILRTERPLAALGRAAQSLWNWATRGWDRITHGHRQPVTGLDTRLLTQRDAIRAVLDRRWWQAVLLTAGRLGLDYGCLLAALRATGAAGELFAGGGDLGDDQELSILGIGEFCDI